MNRPRGRLALNIFLWIVPAGWSIGRAHLAGPAAEPSRSEADDDRGVIQRRTIEEWIAALKDRDAPDGQTVATIGADRAVRLWDVANGREVRRIDGAESGWAMGFSLDGQSLVMTGAGRRLILWDVPGKRLRAVLEPEAERFAVYSIAFAPDGRTLAAAGSTVDAKGVEQQGQVRLYDLAREPIGRRAVLTFDRGWLFAPDQGVSMCSDVAFTPDGRRVAAVAMQRIILWDVATGSEQDSFERDTSGGSDRLAVSPDGRWLAVTSPFGVGVSILDITPPGR